MSKYDLQHRALARTKQQAIECPIITSVKQFKHESILKGLLCTL